MNCSEAKFYENYLTSVFHTNTVISRGVCLPIKMTSKTVIRSILLLPPQKKIIYKEMVKVINQCDEESTKKPLPTETVVTTVSLFSAHYFILLLHTFYSD